MSNSNNDDIQSVTEGNFTILKDMTHPTLKNSNADFQTAPNEGSFDLEANPQTCDDTVSVKEIFLQI